jgi:hypothetical protein
VTIQKHQEFEPTKAYPEIIGMHTMHYEDKVKLQ